MIKRLVLPKSNNKGFSLIELVAVMVIIAILVAIAIPIYNSSQQTARDKTDEANVKILNSATLPWVLADEGNDPRDYETETLKSELDGIYIVNWPVSPNSKNYVLDENGLWKVE